MCDGLFSLSRHVFEGTHLGRLSFVSTILHPAFQLFIQAADGRSLFRVLRQILHTIRVVLHIIQFDSRAMLVFSRHRFCMTICFRQTFPLFKQRRFCFNILESSFRGEIDNISVSAVVYRTDAIIRRSGIDASRGLKGERIFLVCFLLACQYRFKAFAIYFCLRLSSYYIDKSRDNIYVCLLYTSDAADE